MKESLAVDGIVKCVKNAERLIDAAESLFEENREVGTALLVTAIEEYGKALLIAYHHQGAFPGKYFPRAFRSHDIKRGLAAVASMLVAVASDGSRDGLKFRRVIKNLRLRAMRDGVLYVDYADGKFIAPKVDVADFTRVVRVALRLKRGFAVLGQEESCADIIAHPDRDRGKTAARDRAFNLIFSEFLDAAKARVSAKQSRSDMGS